MDHSEKMDQAKTYSFLQRLIEKNPDDAIGTLQDLIVNYCLFPNTKMQISLGEMDKKVYEFLEQGLKIVAIKFVRDTTKCELTSAKKYVEEIENRVYPFGRVSEQAVEFQNRVALAILEKIAEDYNVNLE